MGKVIKFPSKDIKYIVDINGRPIGVAGKLDMIVFRDAIAIGDTIISREEFLALFLLTGLLDEIESDT